MAEFIYPLYQKYLEYFPLSLPIAMLIKDHLVYIKVMDEAKYFLLFLLRPQIKWLLFSLTGISINILKVVYVNL